MQTIFMNVTFPEIITELYSIKYVLQPIFSFFLTLSLLNFSLYLFRLDKGYMSFRDQQKYLEMLKKFDYKLDKKEKEELKMFMKMHKDEEDFDSISLRRLKELYDKYNIPVDKSKYDSFFRKKE